MCEFEKQLEQWLSAPAVNMLARLEELQTVWTAIGKRTPKWSLALFLADYPRDAALEDRIRYIHRGIVCSSSLRSGCSSQIAAAVAYIEERYARLRISAQKPDEYYRNKCDCELNNAADTPEAFQAEAKVFFTRLIDQIKEEKTHE